MKDKDRTINNYRILKILIALAAIWIGFLCRMNSVTLHAAGNATTAQINSLIIGPGADETEIRVTWFANVYSRGYVQIGRADAQLDNNGFPTDYSTVQADLYYAATNKSGYYSNKATLSGLEGGVTYLYRVGNDNFYTDACEYTPRASGTHSEFFYGADAQMTTSSTLISNWKQAVRNMANAFPDCNLLIHGGDVTDSGSNSGGEDQFTNAFMAPEEFKNIIIGSVPGNHDQFGNGYTYADHVYQPNQTDIGQIDGASGDYYYKYNNILFLNISSHTVAATDKNLENVEAHGEFIRQTIRDNPDCDWNIVVIHESMFSTAVHHNSIQARAWRNRMAPVLYEIDQEVGIDMVLHGHDHVYARTYVMQGTMPMTTDEISHYTNPDGIIYVTSNCSSGSKHYTPQDPDYEYLAVSVQEYTPNMSHVSVDTDAYGSTLTMKTYRSMISSTYTGTEDALTVVDEFSITKTPGSKKTTAEQEWESSQIIASIPKTYSQNKVSFEAAGIYPGTSAYGTLNNVFGADSALTGINKDILAYRLDLRWNGAKMNSETDITISLPVPGISYGYEAVKDEAGNPLVSVYVLDETGKAAKIKSNHISFQTRNNVRYAVIKTTPAEAIGICTASIPVEFSITAKTGTGGSVDVVKKAAAGGTVKIRAAAGSGYIVKTVGVRNSSGRDITLTRISNGYYTFKMPQENVTVETMFGSTKAKPSKLKVKKSGKKIKISWQKTAAADGYIVYRSTSKSKGYKAVKTTTKDSYTDKKGLKKGKKYYYKVRAYITTNTGKVESDGITGAKSAKF